LQAFLGLIAGADHRQNPPDFALIGNDETSKAPARPGIFSKCLRRPLFGRDLHLVVTGEVRPHVAKWNGIAPVQLITTVGVAILLRQGLTPRYSAYR